MDQPKITVYCSGSIAKGKSDNLKLCWTDQERAELAEAALPCNIHFLNPDDPAVDLTNVEAMFGRDMYQAGIADFVVVDARERRGIGIGVEMMASRLLGSGLIVVAPPNSYYRKDHLEYRGGTVDNYVHPHVAILADAVVDSFQSAGDWIAQHHNEPPAPKNTEAVLKAIEAYKRDLLPRDLPMQQTLNNLGPGYKLRF